MSWVRVAWSIIANIFAIAIVLSLYNQFTAPFEVVVISLMGLLYTTIVGQRLHLLIILKDVGIVNDQKFLDLYILLKPDLASDYMKEIREVENNINRKTMVPVIISSIFLTVISIICGRLIPERPVAQIVVAARVGSW